MLSDKQSLFLCGLMAGGIFVAGIIEILDNYIVKTILTLIFLVIISNLFYTFSKYKKEEH
jgi:hypothetical protein